MTPAEYLKQPYSRVVVPESDGTFRGEILEFPGCIAAGDTASETLAKLEDVAASWLQSMLDRGQQIPAPLEASNYSGKTVLRLSKSLHQKAAIAARMDGVSLNSFISNCVAERVGARNRQTFIPTQVMQVVLDQGGTVIFAQHQGYRQSQKQVATSAVPQLLHVPHWQKEAANA